MWVIKGSLLVQGPRGSVVVFLGEFTPSLGLSFVPGVRGRRGTCDDMHCWRRGGINRGRRAYGKLLLMI